VKRPRVLVIYKKSAYQIYVRERRHTRVRSLLRARDESVARMMRAHREHEQTLAATRRVLHALDVDVQFRYRSDIAFDKPVDLVVTVGGDGTLLWTSHRVGSHCPMLAINSAPEDSVGAFCSAQREDLADVIAQAVAGRLPATELTRIQVRVDDEVVASRVLNDVLFCHQSPAATTRYAIGVRGASVLHKSSGVWISTAAGSSAAMLSTGGAVQPIRSERLQFRVREPYAFGGLPKLAAGYVGAKERLRIESHIRLGRLYLDGPRIVHHVQMGSRIELSRSPEPLTLLGRFARLRRS
jgi:NAD+ kinase